MKNRMREGLNVERWDREELDNAFEYAKELMGAEELLDALSLAMGTNELYENLEYIFRMHEINYPETYEESYSKKKPCTKGGKKGMRENESLSILKRYEKRYGK